MAVTGRPYFSKFTSPPQTEYEAENGSAVLDLLVYDDDVSPVVDPSPKYTIRFRNIPRIVLECFQTALFATLEQKLLYGVPSLILGLFGVVAPVLFAYFDPNDPKAKYFWVVEQIAVSFVKYYDWEDWGVNTTFGRGVDLVLEHESDMDLDGGSVIAGPSTVPQTSAPSAVQIQETDIAETDIELYGMRTSSLKAVLAWADNFQEQ